MNYLKGSGNHDIRQFGNNSQYNAKKSDETIVATLKQINNAAPTLPVHSPHSPVHSTIHSNIYQNKLSGRYINNNKSALPKTSSKLPCAKTSTSKRNCYSHQCNCVKSPTYDETLHQKEATKFDFPQNGASKTIPKDHISSSVNATSRYRKDSNFEQKQRNLQEFREETTENNPNRTVRNTKSINFLPNRYDNANVATDLNPQLMSRSFDARDNQNKRYFSFTISKSEQTSPNNMDIKKTTFSYDNNKRSTGSLLYVESVDPWTRKGETLVENFVHADRETTDPWIRRSIDYHESASRYRDRTHGGKPRRDYSLETNKKNNYLQPENMARNRESVLSAPPSPHFLNTSVVDSYSVNLSPKRGLHTKSASFSPARGKNSLNPFGAGGENNDTAFPFHSTCTENPEPSIHTQNVKNCLVNVKRLHNRHSFSSTSKEELQLNIRRLSEQMSQMALKNIVQLSISDCNVNNRGSYSQPAEYQTQRATVSQTRDNFHSSMQTPKITTVVVQPIYTNCQKSDPMQETTC